MRRDGVSICLGVGRVRESHVGVKGGVFFGGECNAVVDCRVNVVENVESGVKMALGWSIAVGGKEGMRRDEVGAGGLGEPPNGADNALVLPPRSTNVGFVSSSSVSGHASMGRPDR